MPKQEPEGKQLTVDAAFLVRYATIARELALIQGLAKALEERKGALRAEMRDAALDLREMKILPKSMDIDVNGTKVGTATMANVGKEWYTADEGALEDWALANDYARVSETLNLASLTSEQRLLFDVWAKSNGVDVTRRVTVDHASLDPDLVRLGEKVIYKPTGEEVPGLSGCDTDIRPMIRVPDAKVLFAAMHGSIEVLPSGTPVDPVEQPLETYSIEEVAE